MFQVRLRANNKASYNTKHYNERTEPPKCVSCYAFPSLDHILSECPLLKISEFFERVLNSSRTNMIHRICRLPIRRAYKIIPQKCEDPRNL